MMECHWSPGIFVCRMVMVYYTTLAGLYGIISQHIGIKKKAEVMWR